MGGREGGRGWEGGREGLGRSYDSVAVQLDSCIRSLHGAAFFLFIASIVVVVVVVGGGVFVLVWKKQTAQVGRGD